MQNVRKDLAGLIHFVKICVSSGLVALSMNLYAQDDSRRDIAHDLNPVMPENVLDNDDVVEININPNWDTIQEIKFEILNNPSGIFGLSDSKLIVSDRSAVKSGNYTVSMRVTDGSYWDDFTINVHSVPVNKCVFINHSYTGTEDGTRDRPYRSINTPAYQSGYYYFVARSTYEWITGTINIAASMLLGAYGKGPRPILSSEGTYYGLYLSESSNDAVIRDLRIKHRGSRTIQINAADRITIDNCHLGDPTDARTDLGIRSDGLTSNTKVLNCRIDSIDSDGIYLESEFSEIAYNIITNVSINNDDGDGIQLNICSFQTHVHHNYVNMGGFSTIKGVIAQTHGSAGGYSKDSYATMEYNVLIASSGFANFGICGVSRYDTVRGNFIFVAKSAAEAAGVNMDDGCYIANNIIKGFDRGIYTRGDDLVIYNNTITDCNRGIDANSTATHTVVLKNNIFNNIGSYFILSASSNNKFIMDHNLYSLSGAAFTVMGLPYYNLKELQDAGLELKGMLDNPRFVNSKSDYRLTAESPCIRKGENLIGNDFYGLDRKNDAYVDIGAIEYNPGDLVQPVVSENPPEDSTETDEPEASDTTDTSDNTGPSDTTETTTETDPGDTSSEGKDEAESNAPVVYFIDPANVNDPQEDGSMEHPFDEWSNVTWKEGGVYLQKRGTKTILEKINIFANSVTLGSYGTGDLPVIESNTESFVIRAYEKNDITIQDLNVKAPKAISCVYFMGESSDNNIIENCRFESSVNGVRIIGGIHFIVRYNTFADNTESIYSYAQNTEIYYNVFWGNQTGVNIASYLSSVSLYNNVFYNNGQAVTNTYSSMELFNNIFYLAKPGDVAINSEMDQMVSDNNIFFPEQEGFLKIKDVSYNKLSEYQSNTNLDLNSFCQDPKFINVYEENFGVQDDSPAIDAGKYLGINADFLGYSVPLGKSPDIGFMEKMAYSNSTGVEVMSSSDIVEQPPTVFPNPCDGAFNVQLNEKLTDKETIIRVLNTSGALVRQDYLSPGIRTALINVSGIKEGIYLVTIDDGGYQSTQKLIIQ
jgi:hypothetical protein